MASTDPAVPEVAGALDRFYCHNIVVALWADAVAGVDGYPDVEAASAVSDTIVVDLWPRSGYRAGYPLPPPTARAWVPQLM